MLCFKKFQSKSIVTLILGITLFILFLIIINGFNLIVADKVANYAPEAVKSPTDNSANQTTDNEKPPALEKQPIPQTDKLPETINLNVPFTAQAPSGNWSLPFKEACEEASILMVDKFYRQQPLGNSGDIENDIKNIVEFEKQKLGFYLDTDAEQTASILKDYFGYSEVRVIYDITIEDIKKELAQGRPVIVPAAGRMLGNPNYKRPGPLYHMLVIKGYIKTKFITNDPGTRHGKDFVYDFKVLYNAIHDFNDGRVNEGKKVMIVVEKI